MDVNCQFILRHHDGTPCSLCWASIFFLLLKGHCLNDLGSDMCGMISGFKGWSRLQYEEWFCRTFTCEARKARSHKGCFEVHWIRKGLALYAAADCRNEPPVAAGKRLKATYPSLLERMSHHLRCRRCAGFARLGVTSVQDRSPHMSFILKGSSILALQLKGWFKSKTSIQEYRNGTQNS